MGKARSNHAKLDIYHIYSGRENRNVDGFVTYGQSAVRLAGRPNTDHYINSHFPRK